MKRLFSTFVVAAAMVGGSVIAGDGPAPLSLSEMDAVSAGAAAYAKGGTSLYWSKHSVDIDNYSKAKSRGNALEAADASQATAIEAAGAGAHVIWAAFGSQQSSAAAISYGKYYYAPVVYH